MPPATKRSRKAQGVGRPSKVAAAQSPASISSFTRVSKSISNSGVKKESPPVTTAINPTKPDTATPSSRKRKAATPIEDDDDSSSADEKTPRSTRSALPLLRNNTTSTTTAQPKSKPTPTKRGRGRAPKKARPEPARSEPVFPEPTPVSRKRGRSSSESDSEQSTSGAGILLKRLRIEEGDRDAEGSWPPSSAAPSASSRCSSPPTADTSVAGSDDDDDEEEQRQLPDHLLDLIGLHAALLKTLTLHYAHNGGHVPADLRVVCPNASRAWGKRKVTEADIRLCLGVLSADRPTNTTAANNATTAAANPFVLSDYGRGKICIEAADGGGALAGPPDESRLGAQFQANLAALWARYRAQGAPSSAPAADARAFLASLPRAPVTVCASVAKASPVLAKGQRRLEELRHGIAMKKKQQEKVQEKGPDSAPATSVDAFSANGKGKAPEDTTTTAAAAGGKKTSVLDRIRQKSQLKASASGPALTPEQLARRAALQRAPDVAAVADMLGRAAACDTPRVSFTMPALLEKLRDSLRAGVPRPEAAAAVRVLAHEVAPEWVRVVVLRGGGRASVENVVLEMDAAPSRPEVERRVRELLARDG